MADAKPRILIIGGMTSCSQAIVNYLAPRGREPLVSFLRVADKYLVHPPTTYVGGRASAAFTEPFVEYMQANLTYLERVEAVFTPPAGTAPFDFVFDLTGEVRYNRNDDVYNETTAELARNCGLAAVKAGVKAYARVTHPFYITPLEQGESAEGDYIRPDGVRGYWWHETLRALAAIPELPLVILRIGASYGPQQVWGTMHSRIITGRVYQFKEEEMGYMWSPKTQYHTVHTDDISHALWTSAAWISKLGRAEANSVAGEKIPHYASDPLDKYTEDLAGKLLPTSVAPIAPLFNLVDEGKTTYQTIGDAISTAFEIKYRFIGEEASIAASSDLNEAAQDVNNDHAEAWQELIENSVPPVPSTPLTPYIELHKFERRSVAFTNDKIKRVLGYQFLHPALTAKEVLDIVDSFVEEGTWPN